ncbi:hypothetical protein ID866_6116 [Astraeus odoratus]|nr:hypothetical protein ID866_6116 [Astraeus odoratus]
MDPKDPRSIHGAANVRGALAKRDRWSSREEARRWLLGIKGGDVEKEKKVSGISSEHGEKKGNRDNLKEKGKTIWSRWDERAVTLFVDYAFEDIREPATSEIPNAPPASSLISFTTPKLRKDEESSLYPCLQHTIEPSKLAILSSILSSDAGKSHSARGNLHFIWAEIEEFVSKSARAEMVDAAEHRVMSQQIVKGTGHLIPQEQPDALADALYNVLVSHIAVAAGHTMRASL